MLKLRHKDKKQVRYEGLTLRFTGSVIGLEVLNLRELILDSVCRK